MKFSQSIAAFVGALFVTWNFLLASGELPDMKWVHWVSLSMAALQVFITHLGFNRTPSGTPIPDVAKKFIDNNAQVELKVENPPK